MYAVANSGKFPPDLAALRGCSHGAPSGAHQFVEHKTKVKKDWIYLSGQTPASPAGNFVLASPDTVNFRGGPGRIVIRIDRSVSVNPEPE